MMAIAACLSAASAVLLTGCSAAWQSAASSGDGMYGVHDKVQIANRQRAEAELRKAEAEARRAELEARMAEAEVAALENGYYTDSYSSVVADTYESAYARRLKGFSSPSYRMPSSYYNLRYNGAFNYVTAYDPAFYNIMVSGDQVWVEPKYISSMFGTWGATNVTIGIGIATPYSWYYGWSRPYYSSWWGFPHYSWYDWNWGMCYSPGYWWGYNSFWRPTWGHGWQYGWNHGWGHVGGYRPSMPAPRPQPNRTNIVNSPRPSTRYQSPSSGKNYGTGGSGTNRGTINGSGTFNRGSQSSGTTRPGNNNNGTTTRNRNNGSNAGSSGSSTNRGGSSSFFNGNSNSGSSNNRSSGSGSFGGSSSGGGSRGGSSSGGGSGNGRSSVGGR